MTCQVPGPWKATPEFAAALALYLASQVVQQQAFGLGQALTAATSFINDVREAPSHFGVHSSAPVGHQQAWGEALPEACRL